jgi:DNA polymerase-3 subunit gamma/tau
MQLTIDLRPHLLSQVYGNPNIVKSIYNRAKDNSFPTATLLKGFSGTGKSTIAHILAMMINCKEPQKNGDPCLKCPSCRSVIEERFDRDIQRLDGAQSVKADIIDFTQLISSVPFYDRKKSVFIIEEIDQLSQKAINALLKVLETPSDTVHFILLSMNPKNIDLPNSSRCQTYSFSPFMKKGVLLGLQSDLKRIGKWAFAKLSKTLNPASMARLGQQRSM